MQLWSMLHSRTMHVTEEPTYTKNILLIKVLLQGDSVIVFVLMGDQCLLFTRIIWMKVDEMKIINKGAQCLS